MSAPQWFLNQMPDYLNNFYKFRDIIEKTDSYEKFTNLAKKLLCDLNLNVNKWHTITLLIAKEIQLEHKDFRSLEWLHSVTKNIESLGSDIYLREHIDEICC